ncbi:MAG: DUF1109 domain-containing protein [Rhodospirillaceae bacterium]|nr:DUF1109 domain-containing protein [Rhodospirillaceae bacterium]
MITTPDLIESLAANVRPVKRMGSPIWRGLRWSLLAVAVLVLLTLSQGIRPDIAVKMQDYTFVARLGGAFLTAILAAIAAFMVSLPDRSRLWLLLPLPALLVWMATIGYQCLTRWISLGPNGMEPGETARCFATLVLTGLPLTLAMLLMLRFAAPLQPSAAAMAGGLAVAATTAVAMTLFHVLDASIMVLMWNLGTATLFLVLAKSFGNRMFSWVAPQSSLLRP